MEEGEKECKCPISIVGSIVATLGLTVLSVVGIELKLGAVEGFEFLDPDSKIQTERNHCLIKIQTERNHCLIKNPNNHFLIKNPNRKEPLLDQKSKQAESNPRSPSDWAENRWGA